MKTWLQRLAGSLRRSWRGYGDERAAAALEVVIWVSVLAIPILNIVDVGFYLFQKMQLEYSTQAAARAVWTKCDLVYLPATTRCTGVNTAVTNAAQAASSLTTAVTASITSEGYYCQVGSSLVSTGTPLAAGTTTCANGARSGDYVQITGSYTYTPLFRGVSVTSYLTTPITKTVWARLN